jgi:hypothetical protein
MKAAKTDEEWWDYHRVLWHELKCKPWQFPCTDDPQLVSTLEELA